MANSLRKLIEKQLKENVPLAEIKQGLKEKGYAIEEIDKAVHEVIGEIDKKSSPILKLTILILGIATTIGIGVYLLSNKVIESKINIQKNELSSYQKFCTKYTKSEYNISCEEAIELSLNNVVGSIQNVSISKVRIINPSPPPTFIVKDAWVIDIQVNPPYFDQTFNKEVRYLRVSVDLDGNFIHKEVIDI